MREKYIIMNKRYNILTIIGIIIFLCIFPEVATSEPKKSLLFLIIIIGYIFWSIRLLFLPKCKAVEIMDERIIIYEY